MAIFTYYRSEEVEQHRAELNDPEINELLEEIFLKTKKRFFVRKLVVTRYKWFRYREVTTYALHLIVDSIEQRYISFAQEGNRGICLYVSRSYILTFLYGIISGISLK